VCCAVLKYRLDVFTGDLPDASTKSAVYVMLVGDRGDTGHRKLLKSLTAYSNSEMFQQGQVRASQLGFVSSGPWPVCINWLCKISCILFFTFLP